MIADILLVFAIVLIAIRILKWEDVSYQWVAVNLISALFFFLAFYYFVFTPTQNINISTLTSNVPACTTTCTYTSITSTSNIIGQLPQVQVNSFGFILLATITTFYIIIMIIFTLRDFIRARNSNGGMRGI